MWLTLAPMLVKLAMEIYTVASRDKDTPADKRARFAGYVLDLERVNDKIQDGELPPEGSGR